MSTQQEQLAQDQQKKEEENHEEEEEEEEEEDHKEPIKVRIARGWKKFKRNTKHMCFHRLKGRSYFCNYTCTFWCSELLWLIVLYTFLTGFFIAYMSIASEMMPFTFLFYKTRDPSTIPIPPAARNYFGNSTNTTAQ